MGDWKIQAEGLPPPEFCLPFLYIYLSSEVQLGQRVALIEMVLKQCGHSFVVGSAAGAGAGFFLAALAALTIMKMTKAMIRKSMTVWTNSPQ